MEKNREVNIPLLVIALLFWGGCKHSLDHIVDRNALIGKWSGRVLDNYIEMLFKQNTVSIDYHNGDKPIVYSYELKSDTLSIETFEAKTKIIELTPKVLSMKSLDTSIKETEYLIYQTTFTKER